MTDPKFWRGRRVLVTGHTGFKGAWLTAWLLRMGAQVSGFALPAPHGDSLAGTLALRLDQEWLADICDHGRTALALQESGPEFVIHMAAQSLVRPSYAAPVRTFATNLMGTVNLLDAVRNVGSIQAVLVITTDKVYENPETRRPFREHDPLGGHDPYSASKACAEIAVASYARSFFRQRTGAQILSARSGNVIGGGDWSAERLVPDLVRAMHHNGPVQLRYPASVRPWLHVLEALSGYLAMVEQSVRRPDLNLRALNFAPDPARNWTVAQVVDAFSRQFDGRPGWIQALGDHPKEAATLVLDASAARDALGWTACLSFEERVSWTAEWYRSWLHGGDVRQLTFDQIDRFSERVTRPAAPDRNAKTAAQ